MCTASWLWNNLPSKFDRFSIPLDLYLPCRSVSHKNVEISSHDSHQLWFITVLTRHLRCKLYIIFLFQYKMFQMVAAWWATMAPGNAERTLERLETFRPPRDWSPHRSPASPSPQATQVFNAQLFTIVDWCFPPPIVVLLHKFHNRNELDLK